MAIRLCGGMGNPMVTGRMSTTGSWKLQERQMLISATEIRFFERIIIQHICAGCCVRNTSIVCRCSALIALLNSTTNLLYIPFSALNLSHASFSVANTAALIILTSVLASCGNYNSISIHPFALSLSFPIVFSLTLSGCVFPIAFI